MRYIVLIMLVLALAACGGSSPEGTAGSILAASGAKADGGAYLVTASTQGQGPACDADSAEADGALNGVTVNVCVFPSKAQHDHDEATELEVVAGGAAPDTITVGDTVLVYATGASKATLSKIASAVHGTIVGP